MKKKFKAILACAATVPSLTACSGISGTESAAGQTAPNEADFETGTYINIDGLYISKYIGSDENVIIPEAIGGEKVTKIGSGAFAGNIDITSVTIPGSVKYIGDFNDKCGTFSDCLALKEVIFQGEVAPKFYPGTFKNTPWLEKKLAENPDFLIVNKTLVYCLKSEGAVTIPDGITKIAPSAFNNNQRITGIVIPDSVTEIGGGAFAYCTFLESVTLSENITKIADGTFFGCDDLKRIDIPNGVTSIGENAFGLSRCLDLVSIPDSVKEFGYQSDVSNVKFTYKGETYNFEELYHAVNFADGDLLIVDNVVIKCYYKATRVDIPDTVTGIADDAFYYCYNYGSDLIITYKGKNYNLYNLDELNEAINSN